MQAIQIDVVEKEGSYWRIIGMCPESVVESGSLYVTRGNPTIIRCSVTDRVIVKARSLKDACQKLATLAGMTVTVTDEPRGDVVIGTYEPEVAIPDGKYQGKTAQQWREEARESMRQRAESWERSDTDGFMSQWASQMMAQKYDLCAEVAEADGWWQFRALFDVDGNLVDAVECQGTYGTYWWIKSAPKDAPKSCKYFSPSKARNGLRRFNADTAKGYRWGTVRRRAYVTLKGASATSVSACVVPDRYSDEFTIIDNGLGMSGYDDWN